MNEPWINNPEMVGSTLISAIGVLGLVLAILVLLLTLKGKAQKLVLGVDIFGIALSSILLVIGIAAYLSGQPRGIWWSCFGYPGLLGTPLFTVFFFGFRHEYRKAELRKSMSEDLTFGGNEAEKKVSDK